MFSSLMLPTAFFFDASFRVNKISFSEITTASQASLGEQETTRDKKIKVSKQKTRSSRPQALLWENIEEAFEIEGGHKLLLGPLTIEANIPADKFTDGGDINLFINYSGVPSNSSSSGLQVNHSAKIYPFRQRVKISAQQIKPGVNILKFTDPLSFFHDPGFTINTISFSEIDSGIRTAKTIKELKQESKVEKIADTAPPSKRVVSKPAKPDLKKSRDIQKNRDAIAVVIGNRVYSHKDVPAVAYAINDATAVRQYLIDTLGYRDGNIIFVTDTIKSELEKIFGTKDNHRGMLYNYIKPGKSDVFIYYSGHGAPDPTTNEAYLVPTDCDPVLMALTAYPLNALYGNLPKIEAKKITVVIDACFSGGTNTGQWLIHNASPALLKVKNPVTTQDNLTIFSSAANNQVSSWYPEKQHSMFTYFFLKAIMGDADINGDKNISFQEIHDFVSDRTEGVPYYAKRLHGGRVQTPQMVASNKAGVFVRY